MDTIKEIISDHLGFKKQLFQLAKSHLIKQYRGAAFGWAWAVIKPSVTVAVFLFAFSVGLRKGQPINGYPFFLWLIAGFIPWFYMRDIITEGANSIRKYRYLVQRIKYPIDTIPTFVSMALLATNLVLFLIMVVIYCAFGYKPDIYYLQIPLYYLMMFVFFTLWGLFSGMLSAISKDFLNLVRSIVTALFWLSGVIYPLSNIRHEWVREILLWNPITLLTNGFRNSLIYHKWFWETPKEMIHMCVLMLIMFALAVWAYRKLKKEIPDVL